MQRILVEHACQRPCPACTACKTDRRELDASRVQTSEADEILLGGGDATRWPPLHAVLLENRRRPTPRRIWLEAPARAFGDGVLEDLHARGLFGVLVQIEAHGARMEEQLGVGDGLAVLERAERLGLGTQARVCVVPRTLPIIGGLAEVLSPRLTWLEIGARPADPPLREEDIEALERVLLAHPHVFFQAYRMIERGYVPPCALPALWRSRPNAWAAALMNGAGAQQGAGVQQGAGAQQGHAARANTALPACRSCALADRCRFTAVGLLPAALPERIAPLSGDDLSRRARPQRTQNTLPRGLPRSDHTLRVRCTTPWTTLEIVDPDGLVRQCCSDWTIGARGDSRRASLDAVWNGEGYRGARRAMLTGDEGSLCKSICPRLNDGRLAGTQLRLIDGSPRFVENQLLLASDIAEGRDTIRGKPLAISLCPSTYCNYDCVMCDHGRSPRRELPDAVFDELPAFFPTLHHLTLLGGEPLAHPRTLQLLRGLDGGAYPDLSIDLITNGSLLTPPTLRNLARAPLGNITISVNAGTDEVYRDVQRGIPLPKLLENLDGLLALRDTHPRRFGITLSFVVQPRAVATLEAFGALALARGLPIRLLPLNVDRDPSLDFYGDPDELARVLSALVRFKRWAGSHEDYVREADAALGAIAAHAAHESSKGERRSLPVIR